MKRVIPFILLFILVYSCKQQTITDKDRYEISVEEIDEESQQNSANPYNADNQIYIPGKEFVFSYLYIESLGNEYLFSREGYDLTPFDSITDATITKISLDINSGKRGFRDVWFCEIGI